MKNLRFRGNKKNRKTYLIKKKLVLFPSSEILFNCKQGAERSQAKLKSFTCGNDSQVQAKNLKEKKYTDLLFLVFEPVFIKNVFLYFKFQERINSNLN